MIQVISRRNRLFVINKEVLKVSTKKDEICNALYAAVYTEFQGASKNPRYKNLTTQEMLIKVNEFAFQWLNQRGLI